MTAVDGTDPAHGGAATTSGPQRAPAAGIPKVPERASRREWAGLAVLALPTLMVSFDVFVMLLALPAMSTALDASSTEQLWIMDIYGFMVGGFMITMGSLGDRIGRRKLLLIGAACFGLASVLAAYSASPQMLIAARALLGVAGATISPSTLSLISNLFRDPKQRASAIGIWAGCFTVGAIIGPIVGGIMLVHFWWGSVLLLGVPAMVLLLAIGPVLLPEYRDDQAGHLDLVSVGLSLAAILPIIYGLKELAKDGWRTSPAAMIAFGLIAGLVFVRRQNRLADPLLDVRLFSRRVFSASLVGMLAFTMLGGGIMVFVAQFLQFVDGMSPLRAGVALVPGMVAGLISFQLSPLLGRRFRPAVLLPAGMGITVVGWLVMIQESAASGSTMLVIGYFIACLGSGPLVTLGIGLVIGSAPPEKAGSASGIAQTANEFGYALGVAVLGSLLTAVYRSQVATTVPAEAPDTARDSLAGATEAAQGLPDQTGAALITAAQHAFTTGLHTVAAVSAAVLACVAVVLATALRHLGPIGHDDQPDGHAQPKPDPDPAIR